MDIVDFHIDDNTDNSNDTLSKSKSKDDNTPSSDSKSKSNEEISQSIPKGIRGSNIKRNCKVLVLGGVGVGKTYMCHKLKGGYIPTTLPSTIGAYSHFLQLSKYTYIKQGLRRRPKIALCTHEYILIDIGGNNPDYINRYIPTCDIVLLIFNLKNRSTFDTLKGLYTQIQPLLGSKQIVVVGNMMVYSNTKYQVSETEVGQYASDIGALYQPLDSFTGEGIQPLKEILIKYYTGYIDHQIADNGKSCRYCCP